MFVASLSHGFYIKCLKCGICCISETASITTAIPTDPVVKSTPEDTEAVDADPIIQSTPDDTEVVDADPFIQSSDVFAAPVDTKVVDADPVVKSTPEDTEVVDADPVIQSTPDDTEAVDADPVIRSLDVFDEVEQQLQNPAIDDIVALPCESSEQQLQNITPVDELLQQLQNLNLNGGVEQQPQVSVYVLNEHENVSFISLFQELNQNIVFVPWETLPQLTAGSDRSTELEQQPENSIADDEVKQQPHNTVRRKPSRPETWKRNKAKVWRESGKQYINVAGKTVSARKIQHRKHSFNCRMKCEDKMTADDRQVIHDEFWTLSESQKRNYFARTTCRESKKRTRTDRGRRTNKIRSRVYSYKYYFVVNDVRVQVCKSYYLATLDISNTRICTYYATRNQSTGTPSQRQQGRHVKKGLLMNTEMPFELTLTAFHESSRIIAERQLTDSIWI